MPAARPTRHTAPRLGGGSRVVRLPGSFEHFYLQEYPRVVDLAYALSGSRSGAEDIAQERSCAPTGTGTGSAPMSTRPPGFGGWPPTWPPPGCAGGWPRRGRDRLAARREPALDPLPASDADFWRAVRALPHRQAQTVALYYLEDLSIQETARVLDFAEGTVKAQLARARQDPGPPPAPGFRVGAMNLDTRARASTQAIHRSRTRLDPVAGLDDLLHRHRRRQQLQRAGVGALALLGWWWPSGTGGPARPHPHPAHPWAGRALPRRPAPVSVAVTPDAAWVLNSGNGTISGSTRAPAGCRRPFSSGGKLIRDGRRRATVGGPSRARLHGLDVVARRLSSARATTGRAGRAWRSGG